MPVYTERSAGSYTCTYLGCTEKMMQDGNTGEEELRWIWRFQDVNDPTSAGQIDKITGTSLKSTNSNAYKMAAGILGHKPEPGEDTETHIGETYSVIYGLNQAGNLTITAVAPSKPTPVRSAPVAASGGAASVPRADASEAATDDLPF
jgi:hypothetical protein